MGYWGKGTDDDDDELGFNGLSALLGYFKPPRESGE